MIEPWEFRSYFIYQILVYEMAVAQISSFKIFVSTRYKSNSSTAKPGSDDFFEVFWAALQSWNMFCKQNKNGLDDWKMLLCGREDWRICWVGRVSYCNWWSFCTVVCYTCGLALSWRIMTPYLFTNEHCFWSNFSCIFCSAGQYFAVFIVSPDARKE